MSKVDLGNAPSCAISKYIGSDLEKVIEVADNIDSIKDITDAIVEIKQVEDNIGMLKVIGDNIDVLTDLDQHIDAIVNIDKQVDTIVKLAEQVKQDSAVVSQDKIEAQTAADHAIASEHTAKDYADEAKKYSDSAKQSDRDVQQDLTIVREIVKNTINSGGIFTPTAQKEYPTVPAGTTQKMFFVVTFKNRDDKYTFTTGDLMGTTTISSDEMWYNPATSKWSISFSPKSQDVLDNFIDRLFPVGHILLTADNNNPANTGYKGTWELIDETATLATAGIKDINDKKPSASGSNSVVIPLPHHDHKTSIRWGSKNKEKSQHHHGVGSYRVTAFAKFTSSAALYDDRKYTEPALGIISKRELGNPYNGFKDPLDYATYVKQATTWPPSGDTNYKTLSADLYSGEFGQHKKNITFSDTYAVDYSALPKMGYSDGSIDQLILDAHAGSDPKHPEGFTGESSDPIDEHKHDFIVDVSPEGTNLASINVQGRIVKVFTWVRTA